jgi:hypothetical protein
MEKFSVLIPNFFPNVVLKLLTNVVWRFFPDIVRKFFPNVVRKFFPNEVLILINSSKKKQCPLSLLKSVFGTIV